MTAQPPLPPGMSTDDPPRFWVLDELPEAMRDFLRSAEAEHEGRSPVRTLGEWRGIIGGDEGEYWAGEPGVKVPATLAPFADRPETTELVWLSVSYDPPSPDVV